MNPQTDYITYLEAKVCDQDNRIKELEAVIMLAIFSEANKVNRDLIYLLLSKRIYESMPFSHETIKCYKELLNDCKSPQI
jgi:hypothetical protein